MGNPEKRLRILSDSEIKDIFESPDFSIDEKAVFFDLSKKEMKFVETQGYYRSRIYFVLQLGYFRARSFFPDFLIEDVRPDAEYIIRTYFPNKHIRLFGKIRKKRLLLQRKQILKLCNYKPWDNKAKGLLQQKFADLMRIHANHIDIFREILSYLEIQRTALPSYRTLQDMLSEAISAEHVRIETFLQNNIDADIDQSLQNMLKTGNSLYQFTALKKEPKNFKLKELKNEVHKCNQYRSLYEFAKTTLPRLKISKKCMRHYADMAEIYTVYSLDQMNPYIAKLHLLCYVFNRFQKISNNLLVIFMYHIDKLLSDGKSWTQEQALAHKIKLNETMPSVSALLKRMVDKSIPQKIYFDDFQNQIAFAILPEDQFIPAADYILGNSFDNKSHNWQFIADKGMRMKKNLRPLFLCLSFDSDKPDKPIMRAIKFLKETLESKKSLSQVDPDAFPKAFIPKGELRYIREKRDVAKLKKDGKNHRIRKQRYFHPDKYEFYVYRRIAKFVDNGDVFCNDSTQYRSLQADLLPDKTWSNKEALLKKIGYPKISISGEDRLKELAPLLDSRIVEVNGLIKQGKIKGLKITGKGKDLTWSLPYEKRENETNNPFFDKLPQVSIAEVLHFINEKFGFIDAFTHIKPRFAKQKPNEESIIACISANAFNSGSLRMAGMCDVKYSELFSTDKNFIRLETLKNAGDIVSNAISNQPIFKYWNIMPDKLLAGVDGQKFETRLHNIQARYSSKYFGLNKGVVAYGMVANHIPVNTKIIGANEHESHFLFDIVYNNTSDIDPDAVSGDMHSINQVNFVVMDAINKEFMPNYTKIKHKSKMLCGFKKPSEYKDCILRPSHKVKSHYILDEWDNIQRILASLVMQEATQSTIVKKLSSHARNSKTKRALWEYNNIFMSLYILDFIEDPVLRSSIRRALNRIEAYHQLRRTIAKVHGGKFRGTTALENEVWNQCARLVANCIILYNTLMLSSLIEQHEAPHNKDIVEFIKNLSPVAWQHINLTGRYSFKKKLNEIDFDQVVLMLKNELSEMF